MHPSVSYIAVSDFEPIGNTPDQFASFISSEITNWAKVMKIASIEPE